MISIIIPVYNQAKLLARCLDSIRQQTYNNYEIIIIDDGSTDEIGPVVQKFKQILGHSLLYFDQKNQGANSARNHGARRARGEYLIFCDADVEMSPGMLELMLTTLKNNLAAGYCYSSFKWGWKTFNLFPFDAAKLKQQPYIHTTSLIRREAFPGLAAKGGTAFGWDESINKLQDWDLWLTMLEQGQTGIWLNRILFKVNTGGKQTMSRWLPAFSYKLLPFLSRVKKYNQAMAIIKRKHHLL